MEIMGNLNSNLITKSVINHILSLQLAYATILAGFASFFMLIHVVDLLFGLLEDGFLAVFY